jgi:hypothetical protein
MRLSAGNLLWGSIIYVWNMGEEDGGGEDEEKVNAVGRAMLPFAVVIEVVRHWSDISGS